MSEHNEPISQFSRDSERSVYAAQIERLVSGDLSDSDRLELLAWLDESPARWRQCGLAYLEAQALRESLAEMDSGSRPRTLQEEGRLQRRIGGVRVAAGVVALLLAFALGWGAHRGMVMPGEQTVADGDSADNPTDEAPVIAERHDSGEHLLVDAGPRDGLAMLRFSTGSGDAAREFSVPIRLTDGAIEVLEQPAELPEYVRQQWERRGYHVSQQRRTLQLTLANGRELDVPVDQFLLTYVGQPML